MRNGSSRRGATTVLTVAFCLLGLPALALPLTVKGRPVARIYVKVGEAAQVESAAAEFRKVLKRMSGAEIPVAKVLSDGGEILAKLPDLWKFKKDEKLVGAAEGWWKPKRSDADWADVATFSKSWDDQGLGWYHGDGWYRTRLTMPATAAGHDLRLWFGGFDYNVDVYLNGAHLGEKRGCATPAEFDKIANHLRPGGENVLAVRVSAGDLAEIGTGGIMMPVMIYKAGGGGR
jgi:hypothetical protein